MTTEVTQEAIDRVLAENPALTTEGLGRPSHVSPRAWKAAFPAQREALRSSVQEIEACTLALSQIRPAAKGEHCNSYELKHRVEHWCESLGNAMHISNGSMILAALLMGFRMIGLRNVLNPKLNIPASFLRGPYAGQEFRPALTERELDEADRWTSAVARAGSTRRHVTALDLEGQAHTVEAALWRCEGLLARDGSYLVRHRGPGFRYARWRVGRAATARPMQLAALLHLQQLRAQMATLHALARRTAGIVPPKGAPSTAALRAAASELHESLAALFAAFDPAGDAASGAASTPAALTSAPPFA